MKILGIEIGRSKAPEVVNVDKRKPDSSGIVQGVVPRQSIRVVQDVEKWRLAIQYAESVINPERRFIQELYNEIHFDSHIAALINHLKQYIQGMSFCVYDETIEDGDENEDEEAEQALKAKWFQDFMCYCIEAKIYGYSLIEFGSIQNNKFTEVTSIDRRYVIPEAHAVKKDLYNYTSTIDFTLPIYTPWVMFIGDVKDLGLLNKAAPYFIYKKQALASWAEYQQILGIPPRVGKTDIKDDARRNQMTKMLRDMGQASYAVLDIEDTFEFVNPGGGADSVDTFLKMLEWANKELSKLFVGQTMTTEDGSSKSQSEVHQDMFEMIMQGYKKFITNVVNDQLKPILLQHRIWTNPNLVFSFEEKEEEITYMQKVQIVKDFAPYFDMTEYISTNLGFEVEQKASVPASGATTKLNELKNYYKVEDFKHNCDGC